MSAFGFVGPSGVRHTRGGQPLIVLLALSLASAILIFLAFPPADIGALAWIGLVPLLLALSQAHPIQGLLLGWLFGAVMMAGVSHFLGLFGLLPLIASAVVFGLYYGLFGLLTASLSPLRSLPLRAGAIAAAWTLAEMARANAGPLAYPFGQLAYSQHQMPPILQFASLTGAYGVSFLIALTNTGLATLLLAFFPASAWYQPDSDRVRFVRASARAMLAVYSVVFITYIWGGLVLHSAGKQAQDDRPLQVAAVQADEPISTTRSAASEQAFEALLDRYVTLSQKLSDTADLVVWPETAVGLDLSSHEASRAKISQLARDVGAHMLIGALEYEDDALYNSAFLVSPEGEFLQTYRKIDLVMFGEYVPLRGRLSLLERYPIRGKDFSRGSERSIMEISGTRVGPLICFEAIFPEPAREICQKGAEIIAVLNSDAWAEGTAELLHNSYTAPLRAVEARRFMVRAASTGISAVYDPYGRLIAEVAPHAAGIAMAPVYPRQDLSTYHRWGDGPLLTICLLLILGASTAVGRDRRFQSE
jgi:apolipoprotein N-acyltransferase